MTDTTTMFLASRKGPIASAVAIFALCLVVVGASVAFLVFGDAPQGRVRGMPAGSWMWIAGSIPWLLIGFAQARRIFGTPGVTIESDGLTWQGVSAVTLGQEGELSRGSVLLSRIGEASVSKGGKITLALVEPPEQIEITADFVDDGAYDALDARLQSIIADRRSD